MAASGHLELGLHLLLLEEIFDGGHAGWLLANIYNV
jgi:hypothetical protein